MARVELPAVTRHADPLLFLAAAEHVIARNEVEGVALEVAVAALVRNQPTKPAPYLATVHDGDCRGAAYLYGGEIVALGASDARAATAFAYDLWTTHQGLAGVIGMETPCEAYLAAWDEIAGSTHRMTMHFRQHVLRDLCETQAPPGAARRAVVGDVPWLVAAQVAAAVETGVARPPADLDVRTLRAVEAGRFWLWDNGGPVSYAGWAPAIRPAARIAPVATPPEHRGNGYATALTAALVRELRRQGLLHIVLTTDIKAPLPNAIYARLGFRPTTDSYRFEIVPPRKDPQ